MFLGTSPRWLLEKGRSEDAQKCLEYLRGQEPNSQSIIAELAEIKENIEFHKSFSNRSWHALLTNRNLFARLWRVALLQFMAQVCGATAIKYYLPVNFVALGLSVQFSLLASGIESSLKVGCTIIEMLIIDRAGRKNTLILGSTIMVVSLLVSWLLFCFGNRVNLRISSFGHLRNTSTNLGDCRSMVPCQWLILKISIKPQITPA
jgi:Na+/melibiose symporter-like transporter